VPRTRSQTRKTKSSNPPQNLSSSEKIVRPVRKRHIGADLDDENQQTDSSQNGACDSYQISVKEEYNEKLKRKKIHIGLFITKKRGYPLLFNQLQNVFQMDWNIILRLNRMMISR